VSGWASGNLLTRRSIRVEDLAQRAGLDVKLTLIPLWELGIQHVESGQDRLTTAIAAKPKSR
jgi:hypothetical protein